jgi:hypothetical protein
MYKNHLARSVGLKTLIGDLKPDLVIQGPGGVSVVWDLTSRENPDHVAKTMFYAFILSQPGRLTRIGETHWYQPGGF